eukprot:TRINITY_DN9120_c0_g1_i1.p1 TRINITY_DN9120_c0_g1~~TRINITY_DN9120_c0_g1_i1.p1  ORF type:complete len:1042 (+),score=258.05 TRINITY_DN9120_c0_g1_i1:115-3240(+)
MPPKKSKAKGKAPTNGKDSPKVKSKVEAATKQQAVEGNPISQARSEESKNREAEKGIERRAKEARTDKVEDATNQQAVESTSISQATSEESKKRKAEDEIESRAKEARTDEVAAANDIELCMVERDVEREADSLADHRAALEPDAVLFEPEQSTLNVVPVLGGRVLMALSDGGMQYLVAGARANVGVKSGRYVFETRIVEKLAPLETAWPSRKAVPKPLVRIGFSLAGSELVLGEGEGSICFDADGSIITNGQRKAAVASMKFGRESVVSVVLNVDPSSTSRNTLSLFRDGERVTEPEPLPAGLIGKPLFPHVAYRNVSLHVNVGPTLSRELPFNCRMLSCAAKSDVILSPSTASKASKCDVVFPVGVPDEGAFDWLDGFLEENPRFTELSDRKLMEWASKSGIPKPNISLKSIQEGTTSNDKPEVSYGMPLLDDFSARSVIQAVAPLVPRHYVIMELGSNLIESKRKEHLRMFSLKHYKRIAYVVMGQPNDAFREAQLKLMLQEKQQKATAEWSARRTERERKRQQELKQRQIVELRRLADERRKKAAEEAKRQAEEKRKKLAEKLAEKKMDEASVKGDATEGGGEEELRVDNDAKDELANETKQDIAGDKEEAKEEKTAHQEEKNDGPQDSSKETTQDIADDKKEEGKEEKTAHQEDKNDGPQDSSQETKQDIADDKKEEGKEEKTAHQEDKNDGPQDSSKDAEDDVEPEPVVELTEDERKIRFRPMSVSDFTPAFLASSLQYFSLPEKSEGFQDVIYEWDDEQKCQQYFRCWLLEQKRRVRFEDLKPGIWFTEKKVEWEKMLRDWQHMQKTFKASSNSKSEKATQEESAILANAEIDEIDLFSIADVCDVGKGTPLFKEFAFEDWMLVQLRCELYLLLHAFVKDVGPTECVGMPRKHFEFYYQKYFKKQLNCKSFGLESLCDLFDMVKDTVTIDETSGQMEASLTEEPDTLDPFVKLAEESRRERQRRVDAGDETAKLKFVLSCLSQAAAASGLSPEKPSQQNNNQWAPARHAGQQWSNSSSQNWSWSQNSAWHGWGR